MFDLPDLVETAGSTNSRPGTTPAAGRLSEGRRYGFAKVKPKPRASTLFKPRDVSSVMRNEQKIALRRDEMFVDMNIKRLKNEDRLFRERMKTEAADVSELMARYALAKGTAKRERKPLSPLQRSASTQSAGKLGGDQSLSATQSVRKLNAAMRGEENLPAAPTGRSFLKALKPPPTG
jgi:hypothetical protein